MGFGFFGGGGFGLGPTSPSRHVFSASRPTSRLHAKSRPLSLTSNQLRILFSHSKSRQQLKSCAKCPQRASPRLVVSLRSHPEAVFELRTRRRISKVAFEPRILQQTSGILSSRFSNITWTSSSLHTPFSTLLSPSRTLSGSSKSAFELRKLLRLSNLYFELLHTSSYPRIAHSLQSAREMLTRYLRAERMVF